MDAQLILAALRSRQATFDLTPEGRLCIDMPEGDELEDAEVELVRQHKPELIDLIFRDTGSPIDADYDINERAAIQEEGCTLTVDIPVSDRPKLVMTMADILGRTFTFDELQERCEAAYRTGVHHALSLASEIAEASRNHDTAISWLGRVEVVAEDLRFNRKDEGRGMLIDTIREESRWRKAAGAGSN